MPVFYALVQGSRAEAAGTALLLISYLVFLCCQPTVLYIVTLNRNLKFNGTFAITIRMAAVRGNTYSGYSLITL